MRQEPQTGEPNRGASRQLMIMGMLWLLFALALLLYQILNPPAVKVEWETATEVNTAGFFLYRSDEESGADFEAINDQLIPSRGNAISGAAYSYIDKDVTPGRTYSYVLEEVEFDSGTNRYEEDLFSYTVPQTWWMIVTSSASLLIGLALLLTSLKENRSV
jgi:hypothetical protein